MAKFIIFIFSFIVHQYSVYAVNNCQSYKDKWKQIQLLQKQGHSAKKSVTLHSREKAAWKKWSDCKQGKLKKSKKKSKRTDSQVAIKKRDSARQKIVQLTPGSAFESKKALVVKGEFSGKKQQAWLNFYQPEQKCKRPKSTKTFAYCLAERDKQKALFIKQYQNDLSQ